MLELVAPAPVFPALFCTPALSSVMRFVVSVIFAEGVNVAVHVMPPSAELTEDNVPLAIERSALVKPVTASENVIVTSDVSPAFKAVSATMIVAVGPAVSMA